MVDVPVVQIVDVSIQFLDTVIDVPAFVHVVFLVLKTLEVPQLQYLTRWSMSLLCRSWDCCSALCPVTITANGHPNPALLSPFVRGEVRIVFFLMECAESRW